MDYPFLFEALSNEGLVVGILLFLMNLYLLSSPPRYLWPKDVDYAEEEGEAEAEQEEEDEEEGLEAEEAERMVVAAAAAAA